MIGQPTKSPNPAGINGISFVEYCGYDAEYYESLFGSMGMELAARSANGLTLLYRQGQISFIVNLDPNSFAATFAREHGPCISALGLRVADADTAIEVATSNGLSVHSMHEAERLFGAPVLTGIGGSGLYFVEDGKEAALFKSIFPDFDSDAEYTGIGFFEVDHLTHNVRPGQHDSWVHLYNDVFGFTTVFEMNVPGKRTAMKTTAIMSPCGRFRIAINEPTEPESQIQEFIEEMKGEGVQHIALASYNLYDSIESLRASSIPFQETPGTYYQGIDARLPRHGEDVPRLRKLGILLDGDRDAPDAKWKLLLQIFSKNVVGPVFFEFIQRKDNDGFGEGNAKALFESIELDQIQRGVVKA